MPLLNENQLTDIVDMIVDDYRSRLTGGEVSEITGLILENIPGFETVDSNILTQVINAIENLHDYRYDVRSRTYSGLRNRVIYVRKSSFKDSALGQEII